MHHSQVARMRMIRTPEWKLIRHFEPGGEDELYHLSRDPGELRNLAGSADLEHRAQRAALDRRLNEWVESIGGKCSAPSPNLTDGLRRWLSARMGGTAAPTA